VARTSTRAAISILATAQGFTQAITVVNAGRSNGRTIVGRSVRQCVLEEWRCQLRWILSVEPGRWREGHEGGGHVQFDLYLGFAGIHLEEIV
jgi:hypothetical protein